MKKFLIVFVCMVVYVGCVLWVVDGVQLKPDDKAFICALGVVTLALSIIGVNLFEQD